MTDFQTVAAELLTYSHRPGDATVMNECLEMALKRLRSESPDWAYSRETFYIESGVNRYTLSSYPNAPANARQFVHLRASHSPITEAILEPNALSSSTNFTGAIATLQDSCEDFDGSWMVPTVSGSNSDLVVAFEAQTRALLPGADKQKIRVLAFGSGTGRQIDWEVRQSTVAVASGNFTAGASTTPAIHTITWDAQVLSDRTPADGVIELYLSNATGTSDVHFGAIQWFTHKNPPAASNTSGTRTLVEATMAEILELVGGWAATTLDTPKFYAYYNGQLYFYPVPASVYYMIAEIHADSTRDETTGAEITASSTTQTNEWFRKGRGQLIAAALSIYDSLRTKDPQSMQMAAAVASALAQADEDEAMIAAMSGPMVANF